MNDQTNEQEKAAQVEDLQRVRDLLRELQARACIALAERWLDKAQDLRGAGR